MLITVMNEILTLISFECLAKDQQIKDGKDSINTLEVTIASPTHSLNSDMLARCI